MGYSNFAEYIMAAQTQEFLKKTSGFTLIELLIVMAILGVLAVVLLIALHPSGVTGLHPAFIWGFYSSFSSFVRE